MGGGPSSGGRAQGPAPCLPPQGALSSNLPESRLGVLKGLHGDTSRRGLCQGLPWPLTSPGLPYPGASAPRLHSRGDPRMTSVTLSTKQSHGQVWGLLLVLWALLWAPVLFCLQAGSRDTSSKKPSLTPWFVTGISLPWRSVSRVPWVRWLASHAYRDTGSPRTDHEGTGPGIW